MDYTALHAEIKKGRLRPVYLLYGDEIYLARQTEKAIIEAALAPEDWETSLTVLETSPDPGYLVGMIETAPFFDGRNVLVLRDFAALKSKRSADEGTEDTGADRKDAGETRLLEIITRMPEYSLVIFTVTGKADKRKKLYKAIEQAGAVVEYSSPKLKDAKLLILDKLKQLHKRMTPDAMEYYLGILSMLPKISVAMIHSELEKIALYTGDNEVIGRQDLTEIMAAVPEVNVFEMTEAISRKEIKPALELLAAQIAAGEHPVKLLGLLAFHVRRLWQIKEIAEAGGQAQQVADSLKIHSFIADRLYRQSRSFAKEQLREALLRLAEADRLLKSGRATSSILEKVMIDLCASVRK